MSSGKANLWRKLQTGAIWCAFYFLLWLILAAAEAPLFGLLLAMFAAWVSVGINNTRWFIRLSALPAFIIFFLIELWLGAWDVARRAVHPAVPLNPAWVSYPLKTTDEQVRLLLSALTGLLPGTLASHYQQGELHVHVLDQQQDWADIISRLESHLTRLLTGIQP
ncbi:hypothetical protein MPL1_02838 [Methylophaga lonarensis MPL]|uniref:Uncharacterized protein n=1 Tax=Methylophaga lonarensis MPL TaxID=1286106 RepID=M7P2V2_9GAMM|nr:Na+/H+ antiporter subunit E [Methylophaga lonarensis]EMR13831.1 hypothetical protein MPL1_02838 [Methylophaga lonarensis MPL]